MADREPQGVKWTGTVTAALAGRRLDVYLTEATGKASRAKLQKLIGRQAVTVNGRPAKARDAVALGDVVELTWLDQEPTTLEPVEMALDILYEDDDLLVVNKAAGVSVHPGAGDHGPTLVQGLLHHAGKLGQGERAKADPTAWVRPGIVHRLDKQTSGALVAAKTDRAHAALAKQFQDKATLIREYVALLDGFMPQAEILIESYLFRDPGSRQRFASMTSAEYQRLAAKAGGAPTGHRYAKSRFFRQTVYGERLTLARVRLYTGRTHQIRVHAKELKVPIVGDPVYHHPTRLPKSFSAELQAALTKLQRQLLHAQTLGFTHPESGEKLRFEAPLPADFSAILGLLQEFVQAP